jgi:hypothetical protein
VRGDADAHARAPNLLDFGEVRGHRFLPEPRQASTGVRDVQEDELDAGRGGSLVGSARLRDAEIVELAHGRVSRGPHLAVRVLVRRPD